MPAPRVVLVHGAWHGAWCWARVVPELDALGVTSIAVDLPFTGFHDDVAAVRAAVRSAGEPVVVCGHSYGGLVVDRAVEGLEAVRHVAYLAAVTVRGLDVVASDPPPMTLAIVASGATCTVDPAVAVDLFYGDSDGADAKAAVGRLRPMVMDTDAFLQIEPLGSPPPTTYAVCTEDHALPPPTQRRLAETCDRVVEWPTDHSPFLTRPDLVAGLLADC